MKKFISNQKILLLAVFSLTGTITADTHKRHHHHHNQNRTGRSGNYGGYNRGGGYFGFSFGFPFPGTNYAAGPGFYDPYPYGGPGPYVGPYVAYAGPSIWYGF